MTVFIHSQLWGQGVLGVSMLSIPLCFWAAEKSEVGKGRDTLTTGQNRKTMTREHEALGSGISCHDQVMPLGSDPLSSFM